MTDIARLVFEIDSSSAITAEKNLDKLAKTSDRVETSARKVRTASEQAGIGIGAGNSATERATRSATQHAMALSQAEKAMLSTVAVYGQARDSLGRFTAVDGSFRLSQEATTKVLLQNAKALQAYEREQAQAEKTTASYAAKVDRLRASLDPFAAIQVTLAQRTKLLDDALRAGAIGADQHAAMLSRVTKAATSGLLGIDKYSGGLKNGGQYATQFSYQLNDIVTGLMSGQKPMQVLAQQGGQLFQIFQMAAMEAGGFKAALRALYLEMAPLLATFGLWIAGLAAAGSAVLYLVNQHNKQKKALADLNAELKKQREELEQISPLMFDSSRGADMAAEGLKNFDNWLRTSNVSLAKRNELLRENALRKLNDKAMEAAEKYSAAQKAFDKVNKPGPAMMSSGAPGGFGVVAPAVASDPKNNKFYKDAAAALKEAREQYEAINKYRNQAYMAPEKAFGDQTKAASSVAKATKAVQEQTRAIELNNETISASTVVWPEAAAAAEAYKKQQDAVKAAANDNIKTFAELNIRIPTALENTAFEMDEAARASRDLRFDIEDIGRAIKENDWATGFAGLLNVLAKVKVALGENATELQKIQALAGVGMGVGSIVGGTAGAGISGAASGALGGAAFAGSALGTALFPGLGTLAGAGIGALIGGIGSIFGGSSAKKKAKAQAAAQAAAEAAQREQTRVDTEFSLNVALLRAQGDETKATNMERDKEIARLQGISQASADLQKQLWALDDAATAAAAAAEKAAAVEARRSSIQDEIDKLTMSDAELLAASRAKERAEAVKLDPTLGDLIDKFYGLQDATTAAAKATQDAADAAALAASRQGKLADLLDAQGRSAEAMALRRAQELAAITDPVQKAYQQQIYAAQDAATAATAAAADARYENAERVRQAEAARAAAEIATKAFDDLVAAVTAARVALVKSGDIAGYMAGERSINPGVSPGAYSGAGGFDAAGFNLANSAQQSRLAQDLLRQTSASALDVQNVMGVIGGLTDIIQSPLLTDGIASGIRAGLSDGLSAGGIDKVGVAISGLVDTLSSQAVNQAYSTDVGGITSVLAAQNKAAIAGVFGSVGGLSLMGADVIAFHTALDKLDRAFDAGQISAEDYTRATDNVRAAMGSALDIASDFTAQQERYADALLSLGRAGLDSIAYYFGQIDTAAAALAVSAAAAEEPISLVADAIGRLTSIRDVLGQSAIAAYQGGNATGSMSQAALIAQSAAIAAQALTTSDAARVAAQIAGKAAFATVDAAGIRDASLLLDGLKAFDAKSFEASFLRINNALIDGAINEEQYSALFGTAMATYTDEIGKTTEAFAALRSSAKSLADSLLIDPALTSLSASQQLAEAQRQYRATYNGAMGGDQQAVGAYDGAARSLLSAGKASFATREEYDLLLAGVVSDARFAQDAAPINPYIEANAPIVTELKALREEVAGLRAENKATNEKIALNTSAQRRLAEDAAVNGQLVVTE